MSFRVGIDLVSSSTVRDSIAAHGQRYLERVYSPREVTECSVGGDLDAERLAARFAAKEAAFKALRVGDAAVSWREVEVIRDSDGAAKLSLSGRAAGLARGAGITELAVSITHEQGCAAAVVIAEAQRDVDT